MIESQYSPDRRVVLRLTGDQQQLISKGWTNTGVIFSNGVMSFNGSSYLTSKTAITSGTYSVRIKCNVTSFNAHRFLFNTLGTNNNGTGYIYISQTSGNISKSSGTSYVNGIAANSITSNTNVDIIISGIVLSSGTGTWVNAIGVTWDSTSYKLLGSIDLIEIYKGTLTASEVANLYTGSTFHKPILTTPLLLNFDSSQGYLRDSCGNTLTATAITQRRNCVLLNQATSVISIGANPLGVLAVSIVGWVRNMGYGASNTGNILNNTKKILRINTTNSLYQISSDGTTYASSATNSAKLGSWQFIAATVTLAGVANIYVGDLNNAPALSGSANQSSGTPAVGSTLLIGNNAGNTGNMNGYVNRIWSTAGLLTLADITQLWSDSRNMLF